jgi:hypothetical protein
MPESVTSSRYGSFDPAMPPSLPGPFPGIVRAAPVIIRASRESAWQVLADFPAYGDWCPFTRGIQCSGKLGESVQLSLRWDASLGPPTQTQTEVLQVWDPGKAMGWGLNWPAGALRAERLQWLENHENGTIKYHTYDRFSGALAPIVLALYGKRITRGFMHVGNALKLRLETA